MQVIIAITSSQQLASRSSQPLGIRAAIREKSERGKDLNSDQYIVYIALCLEILGMESYMLGDKR